MTVSGDAAIAMWWTVADGDRVEFHEWHSKEHLPERMGIPGFQRGSRWEALDAGGGMFVTYELDTYDVLISEGYFSRLNQPTPWSVKMMPLHRNMVRSQCHVLDSAGAGIASFMGTLCLSPRVGAETMLKAGLGRIIRDLPGRAGITSARLLRTETPAVAPTTEQQIRGGDAAADWIVLVSGYDLAAIEAVFTSDLSEAQLADMGGERTAQASSFRLVHAMTPRDI